MDIQRANEIIRSTTLINVNYHGVPVFIQKVNNDNRTATVFPLNEMDNEQIVPLDDLMEEDVFTTSNITMNTKRASEIAASPDMKHVTYQGEPVYIQHVDDNSDTARVFPLNNPENEVEVPVDSLKEHYR